MRAAALIFCWANTQKRVTISQQAVKLRPDYKDALDVLKKAQAKMEEAKRRGGKARGGEGCRAVPLSRGSPLVVALTATRRVPFQFRSRRQPKLQPTSDSRAGAQAAAWHLGRRAQSARARAHTGGQVRRGNRRTDCRPSSSSPTSRWRITLAATLICCCAITSTRSRILTKPSGSIRLIERV